MRIGYHVGVFSALIQRSEKFDAYLGSSAGSICAAILAQYKTGEEAKALDHLDDILDLNTFDVWKPWPLGIVSGMWKASALDSAPLRRSIVRHVDPKRLKASGKRLAVCATDVLTGESRVFTEQDPDIVKGIQASCAIPGIFSPVAIGDRFYWDAAVRVVAPVRQAVHLGADDITVSLLLPAKRRYPSAPSNVLEAINRAVDMSTIEILEGDMAMTNANTALAAMGLLKEKRQVSIRIIRPRQELLPANASSIEVNPHVNERCFRTGFDDAMGARADV
jgi:NTE family protein